MTATGRISLERTHNEDLHMCILRHIICILEKHSQHEARSIPHPRNSSLRHRGLLSAKPRLDKTKVKSTVLVAPTTQFNLPDHLIANPRNSKKQHTTTIHAGEPHLVEAASLLAHHGNGRDGFPTPPPGTNAAILLRHRRPARYASPQPNPLPYLP